jgi:UDP:flavonoid glycosyltransferase YjiC (YdhE family)
MFEPDVVVLDYAPSARLAARVVGTPCVLVGSGFVIPPALDPLPPFPGLSWATDNRASESERRVLERVNAAMKALRGPRLDALRALFDADQVILTTLPELDPYGARDNACYVGPLGDPGIGEIVDWPSGATGTRVVAYLRPEMQDVATLLEGLADSGAALVCYAPGLPKETVTRFENAHRIFARRPVQHEHLFAAADACLSYAPAGTVTHSLLSGVPQVLAPLHIESRLTARRVEALGAGVVLYGSQTPGSVASVVHRLTTDNKYRARARAFADRYQDHDPEQAADKIVGCIEEVARNSVATRQRGGRGVSDAR